MLKTMMLALLLLAAAPAPAQQAVDWNSTADSPVRVDSFEAAAAVVLQTITAQRVVALERLEAGVITAAQAGAVQARADQARRLYDQARSICNSDETGDCRGSRKLALEVLSRAKEAL